MTNKNTSSRERQCHARHRSGPKGRAKEREARGNDHLRGRGEGLMSVVCQYEKKNKRLDVTLQKLLEAYATMQGKTV